MYWLALLLPKQRSSVPIGGQNRQSVFVRLLSHASLVQTICRQYHGEPTNHPQKLSCCQLQMYCESLAHQDLTWPLPSPFSQTVLQEQCGSQIEKCMLAYVLRW